jgi:SAM-dependent methyltransferase
MHHTASLFGQAFSRVYWRENFSHILDVGAMNINGSLRQFKPGHAEYVGVDAAPGDGVDVVLDSLAGFPFPDGSFDMCVSTSNFEHNPMFWVTFSEMARVVKPGGFIYINCPSNGQYQLIL